MEDLKAPFNLFDFFGYLFPGFIFTIAIIWIIIPGDTYQKTYDFFNSTKDFKYIITFLLVIIIYGLGHVVSSIGSFLFEKLLVAKWLGYPSDNLFKSKIKNSWLFPTYRKNYSVEFREEFHKKFNEYWGIFKNGDRFMLCFTFIKEKCPTTYERLNIFLSLYDFSRNSAMALLALAFVSISKGYYNYSALFFVLAYVFILRYLKFFRIYGEEIFTTFYVFNSKKKN